MNLPREQRATGIILRLYPLTESSLIVHWLTADLGRVATVAKGARRPKSPFRGKLDLFYQAEFTFLRSRTSELHNLREVIVQNNHREFREQLGYLQQAAYGARLIEQTTETETPLPAVFALFNSMLDFLPGQAPQPQTIFALELKLLEELGLAPKWPKGAVSPGAEQILERLAASDWAVIGRLRLSAGQFAEIRNFLHGFLVYHLGKIPENRAQALAIEA